MNQKSEFALYDALAVSTSREITKAYSTSFSLAVRTLGRELHDPIYSIYALVRLADEIVDSWHSLNQEAQLNRFEDDCKQAVADNYSNNPVLHAFARVANRYSIDYSLVDAFFHSMRLDLAKTTYTQSEYENYIYGSAEVVGLMCLCVFIDGDQAEYDHLLAGAKALGAAFQKVNFLRDLGADNDSLGRMYFPNITGKTISEADKETIIEDIERDFAKALIAINQLPKSSRIGVKLAYTYYLELLDKLKSIPALELRTRRVRVSNAKKLRLLTQITVKERLMKGGSK